jgi:phosphate transport system ATP-binding protein
MQGQAVKIQASNINAWYGPQQVLDNINLDIYPEEILAIIGPSGCGKSTFLRCLNRLNDLTRSFRLQGQILVDNQDVYRRDINLAALRQKVGMVFQHPNPFPMSIFDNVAFGVRESNGRVSRGYLGDIVEEALRRANLWDEVKDKLTTSGLALSGGQQQRLCIARVLAVKPEVVLLDEPCSSLDPASTARIEELLQDLKQHFTIVIVTHNLGQARRISDRMAFFLNGRLVEHGETASMLIKPREKETEDYLSGNFG